MNCVVFGEKWNGSGREKDNFIMFIFGIGIGGVIFIDGKLYWGYLFSVGEWGNMLIEEKMFEEVVLILGLIWFVSKYKGKGKWNGKRIFELYDKGDWEVV